MGTLVSKDFDVDEAQEWCEYLTRVTRDCHRLIDEGRIPATDELAAFLNDTQLVLGKVKSDVNAARAGGLKTTHSRIDMSPEEHRRIFSMNDSLLNLLQILEMRGAIKLDRTPAVGRVADALAQGSFSP